MTDEVLELLQFNIKHALLFQDISQLMQILNDFFFDKVQTEELIVVGHSVWPSVL